MFVLLSRHRCCYIRSHVSISDGNKAYSISPSSRSGKDSFHQKGLPGIHRHVITEVQVHLHEHICVQGSRLTVCYDDFSLPPGLVILASVRVLPLPPWTRARRGAFLAPGAALCCRVQGPRARQGSWELVTRVISKVSILINPKPLILNTYSLN